VVHNGIIENFEEERARLQGLGYTFESQTDTEVIAHSVKHEYERNGHNLFAAVEAACARFHGAYAIGVIADDNHKEMVVARMGCPLLVAFGDEETFIASDVSAVIAFTRNIAYLEDGDIALLNANGIEKLLDKNGQAAERKVKVSELSLASLELGPYSHFMQKEIHEQPKAIADTAEVFLDGGFEPENFGKTAREVFAGIDSIKILACGTSYYSALTGKYWLESIAKIPTDVEIASEYRYRDVIANPKQLMITISQSGETLDTMEALKYAQSLGQTHSLSICNVLESALPRESELVLYTRAGAEIGVASTKAFTTQLVVLVRLGRYLGQNARPCRRRAGTPTPKNCASCPAASSTPDEPRAANRRVGAAIRQESQRPFPWPRHPLSDCTRRRAEAQRNHLYPRRSLSRRRAQTRPLGAWWMKTCRWW
jgi:glucosamine--fructose-6-phosphate aminotransferase (isomerizing)